LYRAYFHKDIDLDDVSELHKAIADIEFFEERQISLTAAGIGKAFGG